MFGSDLETIWVINLKFLELFQGSEDTDECSSNINEIRKLLDCRHPSPISVLDPSYLTESCNSSDTADSNNSSESKTSLHKFSNFIFIIFRISSPKT